MKVEIHRNEASKPVIYEDAVSTYTKGGLYCVMLERDGSGVVHKYPLCGIFRVVEDY